ncbi:MAG: Rqc2 family fibronectin-binding protein, partial [Bacillota bacterium]
ENEITVPLKPSKTAQANAQEYFNRYRKAKSGQNKIKKQLRKTKAEIEYCRNLLYTIEENSVEGLEEVKQEMIENGMLHEKKRGSKKKESAPQPLNYKTSSGRTVLVGKNNRQNDYITFKAAVRRDTWLHAKDIPGSHVILKEAPYPPPEEDLEEAAFLAAYYSKGRESSAVAVDYTEARHVRRRPGGKPGFVFYENYNTITVNPREKDMREMFNL